MAAAATISLPASLAAHSAQLQLQLPSSKTSSAAGLLSLLDDEEGDTAVQLRALRRIHACVDEFWAEIAEHLPLIESLAEDESFPDRELAASVASKVFFHLEEYGDALQHALGAGEYFDVFSVAPGMVRGQYVDTLLSKAIDEYTRLRVAQHAQQQQRRVTAALEAAASGAVAGSTEQKTADGDVVIDPRLEAVVERMFDRCFEDKAYTQVVGVALEARRLDALKKTIELAPDKSVLLGYIFTVCQATLVQREFRLQALDVLVEAYKQLPNPDFPNMCQCLQFLNRADEVAEILDGLIRGSLRQSLIAYQIAFDMVETENQGFILDVVAHYPALKGGAEEAKTAEPAGEGGDEGNNNSSSSSSSEGGEGGAGGSGTADGEGAMDVEGPAPSTPGTLQRQPSTPTAAFSTGPKATEEEYAERVDKLRHVLCEGLSVDIALNFLYRQNHTDLEILRNIRQAVEGRSLILHGATVVAHGFMSAGTTVDVFLRNNLDWLGKATNWAKFSAVASIGVVHKGHVHKSMDVLAPYLPSGGVSHSPYEEGGALYALGLIHANKGGTGDSETIAYLTDALRNAGPQEVVQHGACLGIGLAAMATGNDMLCETLKNTLWGESAVAGEAAAFAIGLIMVGQGPATPATALMIPDLVTHAHDTKHEKTVRGIAIALAMMMYGQEENADILIEQMMRDRDPIMRYGAMFAIALAYAGTANNSAVRRLLHVAVSDVNDDVRRAAVMCIGFVMFRAPEQVPRLVSLLSESFNPHVRYGACMALGIACAGTASEAALEILVPMMDDMVDFVRQGAFIGLALVLMQVSEKACEVVKSVRGKIAGVVTDKMQSVLSKLGAILAHGIIDAGGRNVVMSLQSRAGFTRMASMVGMVMWTQHWYWYPLHHFFSLSLTPTMSIALNKDFNMPNTYKIECTAPPSLFAYPKKLENKKEDKKERVVTAVLSTTAKAKAREARKELQRQQSSDAAMDTEQAGSESKSSDPPSSSSTAPDTAAADAAEKEKAKTTATSTTTTDVELDLGGGVAGTDKAAALEKQQQHQQQQAAGEAGEAGGATSGGDGGDGDGDDNGDGEADGEGEGKKENEEEPQTHTLSNPARVTLLQERHLRVIQDQRYHMVRLSGKPVGVIVVDDSLPEEDEDVSQIDLSNLGEEQDADPPQPFDWAPTQVYDLPA